MDSEQLTTRLTAIGHSVPKSIFEFGDGTHATELNTAHHFAIQLSKQFPEYSCDFDLSKMHEAALRSGYRRPDIVLHERGTQRRNFLVVEMKLRGDPAAVEADAKKIRDVWFARPYCYEFGATIVLNEKDCKVHVISNSQRKA